MVFTKHPIYRVVALLKGLTRSSLYAIIHFDKALFFHTTSGWKIQHLQMMQSIVSRQKLILAFIPSNLLYYRVKKGLKYICGYGGIGRRARFRF